MKDKLKLIGEGIDKVNRHTLTLIFYVFGFTVAGIAIIAMLGDRIIIPLVLIAMLFTLYGSILSSIVDTAASMISYISNETRDILQWDVDLKKLIHKENIVSIIYIIVVIAVVTLECCIK